MFVVGGRIICPGRKRRHCCLVVDLDVPSWTRRELLTIIKVKNHTRSAHTGSSLSADIEDRQPRYSMLRLQGVRHQSDEAPAMRLNPVSVGLAGPLHRRDDLLGEPIHFRLLRAHLKE